MKITKEIDRGRLHPEQHLLNMLPGEAPVGRMEPVKMGKTADDHQQACLGNEFWREEMKTQGVSDQDEARLILVTRERQGRSPIAPVGKDARHGQQVAPSLPAVAAEAPAVLEEKREVSFWARS